MKTNKQRREGDRTEGFAQMWLPMIMSVVIMSVEHVC